MENEKTPALVKRSVAEAVEAFFAPVILVGKVTVWLLSGGPFRRRR